MRLFIAIDFPEEVITYVRSLQDSLDKSAAKLNLAKSYHLTLKFLGEVDENKFGEIVELLDKVKFNKFKLKTADIGIFRDWNQINIIWLGLRESQELKDMHKNIESCLSSFVFKKDFEFSPHITLARVAYVNNKELLRKNVESIKTKEMEFSVDCFRLYQSTLTPDGSIYTVIKEFKVS